ncbi:uncharacterized protein LOC114471772 isoform X2 [Gouania willdenowi]|uniref:uncharacterized protein LOC114471772 isoform X2 n=1 Tax=Gouania willdenowi TaxID=441366 RepID=UPI0010557D1B|nr:uncharacterized protein LOC114471772 isoform X2 [Gouania willdenowi]
MFVSRILVILLGLCCQSTESSQPFLDFPLLSGPSQALLKKPVDFNCSAPRHPENIVIQLQLFKVGDRSKLLGEQTSLPGEVRVIPMVVTKNNEGYLECEASPQNKSRYNIASVVSSPHYLKVIEPVKDAEIIHSGSLEIFEGQTLKLDCKISAGNHVTYLWMHNGRPISQSPFSYVRDEHFWIFRTTSEHSGRYMCVATNAFNNKQVFTSNSSEVVITVKDLISDLEISFDVLKEDSQNYSALVTCHITRGSPPITFSLHNTKELVANVTTGNRSALFRVPVVLGQHTDWFQCQANNGDQTTYSEWMPIKVVPVAGPVMMHFDYDIGENYAIIGLRFYCKAAVGSHLQYRWFLNKTLLHQRGSFYYVEDQAPEQSILLLSVGVSSTGTYHCQVSDSFDNTTTIRSASRYLDKEVLNSLPVLVVAVVFGCFTTLISLVSICCCIGVVYRKRVYGERSPLGLKMERGKTAYEDDLDISDYGEDYLVLQAAKEVEFDQPSQASLDE